MSLSDIQKNKLKDITYVLAVFFNYLSKPRSSFISVSSDTKDIVSIRPYITRDMANYVITEIFPCKVLLAPIEWKISNEIKDMINTIISDTISNKEFLPIAKDTEINPNKLKIDSTVYQMIWNYISNINDTNQEQNEAIILSQRVFHHNYGFSDDILNATFQTILYLAATLLDWLEETKITVSEITTVYKMIYPQDIQNVIFDKENNEDLIDIITKGVISMGFIPTPNAVKMIADIILDVDEKKDNINSNTTSKRIMNRFMGLARL